ncbi:hypothetical protein GCM10009527_044900 [Actinomadura nitritigenes]|uniref:NifU family protein n=1 Tax=Actinomadura nitritigenes TaxID=134602 RepID=A0ABS3RG74_9ACTN|nr:NifU family protein [Actinomadura nitritigenes]MBO2445233.1 NifU family protein [Actinomadura nitritigenes]
MTHPLHALHPQRTDRPDELRWHLPPGTLPAPEPAEDPGSLLPALLNDDALADVRIEPDAVITRLAPGRDWRTEGPRIRTALHTALTELAVRRSGRPAPADRTDSGDDALRAAAENLIAGPVGDLARSHGGRIDLVAVQDGIVEVALHGACHGCPAARTTLTVHLEDRLRELHPALRAVRAADIPRRRRLLPLTPAHRRTRHDPAAGGA